MAEAGPPSPFELWRRAGGGPQEYRRLMREHGHLVPGKPEPLPCGWPHCLAGTPEAPPVTLRRAAARMRADAGRCGDPPGSFIPEVASWLDIEAAAQERRLPDDNGTVHVALRIARAYLGEPGTEEAGR